MVTSGLNPNIVKTALDRLFHSQWNVSNRPEYASAEDSVIFKQYDSTKASETIEEYSGVGAWETRSSEIATPAEAQPRSKNTITYTNAALAKGVEIGKWLFDDDQHMMVDIIMSDFARKGKIAKDSDSMSLFRTGFSTVIGDGVALFSASHPIDGGTASNLITPLLGELAVQTGVKALQEMKERDGVIAGNDPAWLLVCPDDFARAARILKTELRSNTTNNDLNWYSSAYGITLKMSPYLGTAAGGSDNRWFLGSSNHQLLRFLRQDVLTNMIDWTVRPNRTYYYSGEFRQTVGAASYVGVIGSNGTTGTKDA